MGIFDWIKKKKNKNTSDLKEENVNLQDEENIQETQEFLDLKHELLEENELEYADLQKDDLYNILEETKQEDKLDKHHQIDLEEDLHNLEENVLNKHDEIELKEDDLYNALEEETIEEAIEEETIEEAIEEETIEEAIEEETIEEETIEEETIEEEAIEEETIEEAIEEEAIEEEAIEEETIEEETIEEETIEEEAIEEETIEEEAIEEEQETEEAIEEEAIEEEQETEEISKERNIFSKIKKGLSKTRDNILGSIEQVLNNFKQVDEELFEELEESLIMADISVETSLIIIENLREKIKKEKIKDSSKVKEAIIEVINNLMQEDNKNIEFKSPTVILIIGVNGVGKTTTIGKLTNVFKSEGKKVLLAAGDTFRAAAIDQLQIWANRNEVDIIKHQENSDPAAVIFDGVAAAKARKADILICDTAGRLHNKKNLMEELKKISRIIERDFTEAQVETFLVLDATTGQNAVQQAKLFNEVSDITGIVLTKLDGTAKGGAVISIKNELNIPVKFIGVGEAIDDLIYFDSEEFSKALFE